MSLGPSMRFDRQALPGKYADFIDDAWRQEKLPIEHIEVCRPSFFLVQLRLTTGFR